MLFLIGINCVVLFALFAVSSLNVRGGRVSPVVSLPIIVQPLCFGVKAGGFRPFEASYFSHPCAPATLGRKPIIGISILLRRNVSTKESVTQDLSAASSYYMCIVISILQVSILDAHGYIFSEPFGPYVEACTIPVSTSFQEPKSWPQPAMSNLLPYCSRDHPLPIAGCPCPRTSSLDTLSPRDVRRVLV